MQRDGESDSANGEGPDGGAEGDDASGSGSGVVGKDEMSESGVSVADEERGDWSPLFGNPCLLVDAKTKQKLSL